MTIFRHTYSGLITKGLGLPACCGMITMFFTLFKCTIEVVAAPAGGGPVPRFPTGLYTPQTQQWKNATKFVLITVTMDDYKWRRSYILYRTKAAIAIEIINFVNAIREKTTIAIEKLKQATKNVTAKIINK